ncbi:hypothetical protein HG717_36215 (plasmid) [Rhodococcus erythropolis]|uniref:hypothetical protein n=1 Tax=Rhodococcus erythropolis TaxID=1833 RepID=UPI001C9B93A4|nr:hypothetical protein [Rhodococcus erythropolis]MBY6389310.1 hypothetical protein [Rhodococcus erythropolis]
MNSADHSEGAQAALPAQSKLTGAAVGAAAVAACAACCAAPIAGVLATVGVASGVAGLLIPALWGLAVVLGMAAGAVYLRRRFRHRPMGARHTVTLGLPTYVERNQEPDRAGRDAESLK